MFHRLAHDESRWVRTAAYAVLGLFISTFVDIPASSECIIVDATAIAGFKAQHRAAPVSLAVEAVEDQRYNTHQYWKEPLPDVDADEMMALLGLVSLSMQSQPSQSPGETRQSPEPTASPSNEENETVKPDLEQVLLTENGCLRLPRVADRLVARPRCSNQPVRFESMLMADRKLSTACGTCSWRYRPRCWRRSKAWLARRQPRPWMLT